MNRTQVIVLSVAASLLGAVIIWTLIGFGRICWRACRKESSLSGWNTKAVEARGANAV